MLETFFSPLVMSPSPSKIQAGKTLIPVSLTGRPCPKHEAPQDRYPSRVEGMPPAMSVFNCQKFVRVDGWTEPPLLQVSPPRKSEPAQNKQCRFIAAAMIPGIVVVNTKWLPAEVVLPEPRDMSQIEV
jgi:hypothetical protein